MANELRVRQNFLGGLVEDNPLTAGATVMNSASLAAMVAIGSTQHMPIVLDPDGIYGEPEIAYVTAHASGATTATILRSQEGSTARQHNRDTPWLHGTTNRDLEPTLTDVCYAAAGTTSYSMVSRVYTKFPFVATNNPTALWDDTNKWYTVPYDGIYTVSLQYYFLDGAPSGYDYAMGPSTDQAGITNYLVGWVTWQANAAGVNRNAGTGTQEIRFTAGQHVSMFYYNDSAGTVTMSNAYVGITLKARG